MRISDWSSDVCSSDLVAARHAELAPDKVGGLDAVGAFIDRGDARVAIMLRCAGLLDEAHAAMDLDAQARDLAADVGRMRLGQWHQYFGAPRRGLAATPADIGSCRRIINERPRRPRLRAHPPPPPAPVGGMGAGA